MDKLNRTVLHSTPFIDLVQVDFVLPDGKQGRWFGVTRNTASMVVAIAAITTADELIFVRQPRPMINAITIELPAGLCDVDGEDDFTTAKRELLEETGYASDNIRKLIGGSKGLTISSGLTDERLCLYLALGATKVTEPLINEQTEPILVPLEFAFDWLCGQVEAGADVDYKLFGTIRLIEKEVLQ